MKTCLVIADLAPGGAQKIILSLGTHLTGQGHDVTLICLHDDPRPPLFPIDPGLRVIRLSRGGAASSLTGALRGNIERIVALAGAFRSIRPDIAISFMTTTNVTALLAGLLARVPCIVSERVDPRFEPTQRIWRFLRRITYPLARICVAQTQQAAEYLSPFCRHVHIIPNPIEPAAAPADKTFRKRLVAVGRLTHQKGFDVLIDAFALLTDKHPEATLTIWGEGEERHNLQEQIDATGLNSRVSLPGISGAPGGWRDNTDLFILSSRYEGFPNVLGEAIAANIPVIATDVHGAADIAEAPLIPPGNAQALANAIDSYLRNPLPQRHNIGHFAPGRVMGLWDEIIRKAVP